MKKKLSFIGLVTTICFMHSVSSAEGWTRYISKSGNICHDQDVNFLKNYFGNQIKILGKFDDISRERNGLNRTTWIKTDLCEGLFAFTYGSTRWEYCRYAHYGRVPKYAHQVWAIGSCKKFLPGFYHTITREEIADPVENHSPNHK